MMDQYQYDELSKLSMSSVNSEHSQRMDPRGRRRGGGGGGEEEEGEILKSIIHFIPTILSRPVGDGRGDIPSNFLCITYRKYKKRQMMRKLIKSKISHSKKSTTLYSPPPSSLPSLR